MVTILLGRYFIESTGERENENVLFCSLAFSVDLITSQHQLQILLQPLLYYFFLQDLKSCTDASNWYEDIYKIKITRTHTCIHTSCNFL